MESYLIDVVLLVALLVVALRSGRMVKELKDLRASESGLVAALEAADRTITRAASVIVSLKHEGVETLRQLEGRLEAADAVADRLDALVSRADWHGASRSGDRAAPSTARQDDDRHGRAEAA